MPEGIKRASTAEKEAIKKPKVETVVWEVEEPSEFRKEDELKNIGKEVDTFRVFTNVSYPIIPPFIDHAAKVYSRSPGPLFLHCILVIL